jgi:hypothetical protein
MILRFIVSAKHGQSPINPVKVNKPGHFADLVASLPDAATDLRSRHRQVVRRQLINRLSQSLRLAVMRL